MKHIGRYLPVTLLLAWVLVCPIFAASAFPDVSEGADYAGAVSVLNDMGIIKGDSNGNFNPNKTVTRAEMAAFICRMLGEPTDSTFGKIQFQDVPANFWAQGAIDKASSLGIIKGYADGTFRPQDTVTYAQALAMMVRAMGLEEQALNAGGYPTGYMTVAEENGLAGKFQSSSNDPLMRWQVATIIIGAFL